MSGYEWANVAVMNGPCAGRRWDCSRWLAEGGHIVMPYAEPAAPSTHPWERTYGRALYRVFWHDLVGWVAVL